MYGLCLNNTYLKYIYAIMYRHTLYTRVHTYNMSIICVQICVPLSKNPQSKQITFKSTN